MAIIKCRKADDHRCHPTSKDNQPSPPHISINSTNAPSDNEPPPFASTSGIFSSLVGSLLRARNLASATPYHRTLRLVLAMRLPLATAVKSIWYTG